jgi:hypothetical protein
MPLELTPGTNVSISQVGETLVISATAGGGGGGAVDSVNAQTGVVVLDATDVGADPAGTGASAASSAVSTHNSAAHTAAAITALVSAATTTTSGKVEFATEAEHITGTSETLAANPAGVMAIIDDMSSTMGALTTPVGTDNVWWERAGVAGLMLASAAKTFFQEGISSAPDASETVKGIIEIATEAEHITGTSTVLAANPAGVAAMLAAGTVEATALSLPVVNTDKLLIIRAGTPYLVDVDDYADYVNVPDVTAPTLVSAEIPAAGNTIEILFNENVEFGAGGNGGFVLDTSGAAVTLTYASGTGTDTLVYNLSRTILSSETISDFDYTQPTNGVQDTAGNDLASFSNQQALVTNNATDATAPTLVSATIPTTGDVLNILFDEAVSIGAGGNGGFTIAMSGGAVTLAYASGSGSTTLVYTLSRTVDAGETCSDFDYVQPGNGVEDASGNDLASFSNQQAEVTNNSTQGSTDPLFANVIMLAANDNAAAATTTFDDQSSVNHTLSRSANNTEAYANVPAALAGMTTCIDISASANSFIKTTASAAADHGTANYTFEGFVYIPSVGTHVMFDISDYGFRVTYTGGNLKMEIPNVGDICTAAVTLNANTWYYYAAVRAGTGSNQTSLYWGEVAGGTATRIAQGTDAQNYNDSAADYFIGSAAGGNSPSRYVGPHRATVGASSDRYSGASFTIPSLPFPNS